VCPTTCRRGCCAGRRCAPPIRAWGHTRLRVRPHTWQTIMTAKQGERFHIMSRFCVETRHVASLHTGQARRLAGSHFSPKRRRSRDSRNTSDATGHNIRGFLVETRFIASGFRGEKKPASLCGLLCVETGTGTLPTRLPSRQTPAVGCVLITHPTFTLTGNLRQKRNSPLTPASEGCPAPRRGN
jgi:hypothetical protein